MKESSERVVQEAFKRLAGAEGIIIFWSRPGPFDAVAQPSDSTVPKNSGRFVCVSTMA